ncbi:DUF6691 family protein [Ideonella sp.]|jgi:uncharacterized membrane protein YedE/YeeE|uniref:DUF6691 family protein n=1 Tax=Ideonella sp. TaxID=1929293 RepID=UPI0037BF2AC3
MKSLITALLSGLVFGLGLIASGMTNPAKVAGFLDLFGAWDPSLALVMGGAIGVGFFAFKLAGRSELAWNGSAIRLPDTSLIDKRLILGGVLFGTGWGLGGFCPGPGIVAAASGVFEAAIFVATMLLGMAVYDLIAERKH